MTAAPETTIANTGSLRARKHRLEELHSYLRSVDNLRSDEALDEIAVLLARWVENRSSEGDLGSSPSRLTSAALAGAVSRLDRLLRDVEPGHGGDVFQALVDVGVRSGMGQYFTPRPVARAMAAYLAPSRGETWLDPFCGGGLLLGALSERASQLRLFGIDRDARVLNFARIEAALHHPDERTTLLRANALDQPGALLEQLGAPADGFDGIVANPPFGVEIHDPGGSGSSAFELASPGRTPLEVLGLEQCLALLREGGRLGIVLPQSILSNRRLEPVRSWLLDRCSLDGVLSLPEETFRPFKGVGKASVLFVTKASPVLGSTVRFAVATSVGWDATGNPNGDEDCTQAALALRSDGDDTRHRVATLGQTPALSRNLTAEWLTRPVVSGAALGELCSAMFKGRNHDRRAYEVEGVDPDRVFRVLKVGDLTNTGIDWEPGERSRAVLERPPRPDRRLQLGDLVTTAAAHHPKYVGAKVDIVDCEPPGFESRCVPVAEVIVLRPDRERIDPVVLLLWLRSPEGRAAIQSCVTGQTAHLRAADLAEVVVPQHVCEAIGLDDAVEALRQSLELRRRAEAARDRAIRCFGEAIAQRAAAGA